MVTEVPWGSHDGGAVCECVSSHSPSVTHVHRHHVWPLGEGGPDTPENVQWICPTSHDAVHTLLRAWLRYEGEPPWEIRRRYGPYIRALAERGFRAIESQTVQ